MPKQIQTLDGVFHALSDSTRRRVVQRLSRGPATVSELAEPFNMALPSFMQHLRVLERSGLVASSKAGRVRTCRIRPREMLRAENWIAEQRTLWEERFDRMEAYLDGLQADEGADD